MTFGQGEKHLAIMNAVDSMDEKHLRWMIKTLLSTPDYQEMDKPLESLKAFLNQIEADYLFIESVLDAKKTLDSSYMPYNSYYKDRLVKLMLDTSKDAGIPEEGVIFQTLASEVEVAFLQFWDGHVTSEEFDRKKQRLVSVLEQIVRKAIRFLGVNYFNRSQQDILATILGKSKLSEVYFS